MIEDKNDTKDEVNVHLYLQCVFFCSSYSGCYSTHSGYRNIEFLSAAFPLD